MPSFDEQTSELFSHAEALGLETGYWDVQGAWHEASDESVIAVLAAAGAPVSGREDVTGSLRVHRVAHDTVAVPPVVVVIGAAPLDFELCLVEGREPGRARIVVRAGDDEQRWELTIADLPITGTYAADGRRWLRRRVVVGAELPVGYHHASVEIGGDPHPVTVLAAPEQVAQLESDQRLWGAFSPLYALRSETGRGPNVFDLDALGRWIDGHGGRIVATLPLLAGYLDRPYDPSPYSPVSRRFWNEMYLDVTRLPELAASPAARALLDAPWVLAAWERLRSAPVFDARGQAEIVTAVLDELTTTFFAQPPSGRTAFDAWVAGHPDVIDYGRFRALVERTGTGWHGWTEAQRGGTLASEDYDRRVAARHVYAQWSMHRQLGDVRSALSARDQRLYLDLPVGSSGDGFDTWADQSDFAWGAAVGAPPDDFFSLGQNWGFPPLRPDRARAEGHRHLAECLRHHMTHAGMVRLDHVMGLHRLFWVPDGMDATNGVYVRYPTEEQFAVVAIESHLAGCVVVGEDLGTVPDAVRESMDRHRVLRSYVAEFVMPEGPEGALGEPDAHTVASVDTHDTPPFAAFLAADDVRDRIDRGLLGPGAAVAELESRRRVREDLAAALSRRGLAAGDDTELLRAVLEVLGESDAPAVLVSLDDLVGSRQPQNVPGTGAERPNWVHRLDMTLEDLAADPGVEATLDALQGRRLSSYFRASTHLRASSDA